VAVPLEVLERSPERTPTGQGVLVAIPDLESALTIIQVGALTTRAPLNAHTRERMLLGRDVLQTRPRASLHGLAAVKLLCSWSLRRQGPPR